MELLVHNGRDTDLVQPLVVLPLLPNQVMGPYDALNPRSIWIVVILVMAISAAA